MISIIYTLALGYILLSKVMPSGRSLFFYSYTKATTLYLTEVYIINLHLVYTLLRKAIPTLYSCFSLHFKTDTRIIYTPTTLLTAPVIFFWRLFLLQANAYERIRTHPRFTLSEPFSA